MREIFAGHINLQSANRISEPWKDLDRPAGFVPSSHILAVKSLTMKDAEVHKYSGNVDHPPTMKTSWFAAVANQYTRVDRVLHFTPWSSALNRFWAWNVCSILLEGGGGLCIAP